MQKNLFYHSNTISKKMKNKYFLLLFLLNFIIINISAQEFKSIIKKIDINNKDNLQVSWQDLNATKKNLVFKPNIEIIIQIFSVSDITDFNFFINDKQITNTQKLKHSKTNKNVYYFVSKIQLNRGNNYLKVSVENLDNETVIDTCEIIYQKRIALVFGNSHYLQNKDILKNPVNDADSITDALNSVGFTVMKYKDATCDTMNYGLKVFSDSLKNYDVGLFYYAGHGLELNSENYLLPVDYDFENYYVSSMITLQTIFNKMDSANARVNIIILDACRNNPFLTREINNETDEFTGFADQEGFAGSITIYSTGIGKTASDGSNTNGLYTGQLIKNIRKPNLEFRDLLMDTRNKVIEKSNNIQVPWERGAPVEKFYFNIK